MALSIVKSRLRDVERDGEKFFGNDSAQKSLPGYALWLVEELWRPSLKDFSFDEIIRAWCSSVAVLGIPKGVAIEAYNNAQRKIQAKNPAMRTTFALGRQSIEKVYKQQIKKPSGPVSLPPTARGPGDRHRPAQERPSSTRDRLGSEFAASSFMSHENSKYLGLPGPVTGQRKGYDHPTGSSAKPTANFSMSGGFRDSAPPRDDRSHPATGSNMVALPPPGYVCRRYEQPGADNTLIHVRLLLSNEGFRTPARGVPDQLGYSLRLCTR